jgi:hypothetical protein
MKVILEYCVYHFQNHLTFIFRIILCWTSYQPRYKPIRDKFPSLFENVVLNFFFQLDHQVDISLYLIEATPLHHSKGISWFEIIMMNFQSHFQLHGL